MKWGQQAQSLYCPIFKILRNVFFYKHKFIKNKIFFSYRKIETNPSPTQLIYFSWIRFYTPSFIVITIWETAQIYRLNSVAQNINRTSYFASGNKQHCKKVYIMSKYNKTKKDLVHDDRDLILLEPIWSNLIQFIPIWSSHP